jgi:DNA-binding transcriptional ArsR family regulator
MLQHIIPSKTRRKILALFFQNINQNFHLRKVAREVDEEINAVKRELDILEGEGLLKKERRVNKVIYSLNPKYIFYDEFLRIFTKECILTQTILKNLSKLGKLKYIVLSHKYAKRQKISEGEIYLLFVGIIVLPEITKIVAGEEKDYGSEINYTAMTEEEFNFRKKNNDPFIWSFLKQPKIMIFGEEESLMG